jgi:hypothetical protein
MAVAGQLYNTLNVDLEAKEILKKIALTGDVNIYNRINGSIDTSRPTGPYLVKHQIHI